MEKGNMIRKQENTSVGKRMNIIVLGHVDNDNVAKFIQILDKYNIKSKILFNHYGRPNKCKRELDAWFRETQVETKPVHPIIAKLIRADNYLEEDLKKFKEKFGKE